uniref:Uncharacterized protein n=1 Tax=Oryza barthii TaxID=65489 RepID=A0A075BPR7_9ORYZ|nr:hypothetical protein OB_ABa0085D15.10 [Oryza barthii]
MAGGRSSSSSRHHHGHHHHHHHRRHRSETSCPPTSVAVAAARAGDAHAPDHPLRRSQAFPPRRQPPHQQQQQRMQPQRWDSEQVRQPRCGEVAGAPRRGAPPSAAACRARWWRSWCSPRCARRRRCAAAPSAAPRRPRHQAVGVAGQAGEIYELLVDEGGAVDSGEKKAPVVWPVAAITAAAVPSEEAGELEKEVWARFYGAGFWRSPSQLSDHMR